MLHPVESFIDLLRCPITGKQLVDHGSFLRADEDDAPRYEKVDGRPVIVDFEKSILDPVATLEQRAASCITRSGGKYRATLKHRMLSGSASKRASQQAEQFLQLVKQKNPNPRVLIIGGGTVGIGSDALFNSPDIQLLSFDIYASPHVQFIADAHQIPLRDGSVDGVWIQYVLEHVLNPHEVAAEIHRVLTPEGIVYAETPFLQQVHEAAYDFTRFTHSGHRWLFRQFAELDSGIAQDQGYSLLWTLEHVVRGLTRSRKAGQAAKLSLFWLQYVERLISRPYRLDAASSFFFLGRRSDTSLRPRDMVDQYRGAM